jgi:hypothetical protein
MKHALMQIYRSRRIRSWSVGDTRYQSVRRFFTGELRRTSAWVSKHNSAEAAVYGGLLTSLPGWRIVKRLQQG